MNISAVILAAGLGKRMRSSRPKVLHEISNRPMLLYVIDAVKALNPKKIIIVVGKTAEEIKEKIQNRSVAYVTQNKPLGTGNALIEAKKILKEEGASIVVLNGDCPLITSEALNNLLEYHKRDKNDLSFLSFMDDKASGYGRVLRDNEHRVTGIVEDKHATSENKNINELNGGVYVMEPEVLNYTAQLKKHTSSGEYYLTDIVGISSREGKKVNAYNCHPELIRGVNTREELIQVSEILNRRAAADKLA
jgi:bifunctional UDP-N-acetylglucosamine pyrophosphorylase/glucosamine-1-phosphate N-acetyltransferase